MAVIYCVDGLLSGVPTGFLNPYSIPSILQPIITAGSNYSAATVRAAGQGVHRLVDFQTSAIIGLYQVARFYSLPLSGNQKVGSGSLGVAVHGCEDVATANAEWDAQLFVVKPDSSVRGTIWMASGRFTEMQLDAISETIASGTGAIVSSVNGDRIALEIYYRKTGAKAETLSRLLYGTDTASGNTRVTLQPATILFQPEPFVAEPIGCVYLNPTSGLRTMLGSGIAGMVPIKLNPDTGQRGITSSFGKYITRLSEGVYRATS